MSTQPFSVLYDQILPHAKNTNAAAMDACIRRAARYFCAQSSVWRDSISIDVVAGLPEYSLVDTNSQAEVLDIDAAQYNTPGGVQPVPMTAASQNQVSSQDTAAYPCIYFLDPPSRIVIGPLNSITQDVPAGLWVRVILQPTLTATTLDSGLLQRADQAIANGALSWLLSENNAPWTNLPLAAQFKREFEANIAHLKTQAELGFQRSNLQTQVYRW